MYMQVRTTARNIRRPLLPLLLGTTSKRHSGHLLAAVTGHETTPADQRRRAMWLRTVNTATGNRLREGPLAE